MRVLVVYTAQPSGQHKSEGHKACFVVFPPSFFHRMPAPARYLSADAWAQPAAPGPRARQMPELVVGGSRAWPWGPNA